MTLVELQKVLGDRIEVTLSNLTPEQRKIENQKTELVIGVAKQMTSNANTIMKVANSMEKSADVRNLLGAITIPMQKTLDKSGR